MVIYYCRYSNSKNREKAGGGVGGWSLALCSRAPPNLVPWAELMEVDGCPPATLLSEFFPELQPLFTHPLHPRSGPWCQPRARP